MAGGWSAAPQARQLAASVLACLPDGEAVEWLVTRLPVILGASVAPEMLVATGVLSTEPKNAESANDAVHQAKNRY